MIIIYVVHTGAQDCSNVGRASDVDEDVLDVCQMACCLQLYPAVGSGGRHGGRPLRPLVGHSIHGSGCGQPAGGRHPDCQTRLSNWASGGYQAALMGGWEGGPVHYV
jgi:hypothetical protein